MAHHPLADAINGFGATLLASYREANEKNNVVFSPLSLSMAFLLAHHGAGGQTRDELGTLFGFKDASVVEGLMAKWKEMSDSQSALLANRLYFDDALKLEENYKAAVGPASFRQVDFRNKTEEVREEINAWVSEQTHAMIPQLIGEGMLMPETLLTIVNALYFRGTWQAKFEKDRTHHGIFKGVNGEETVPFMEHKAIKLLMKWLPELDGRMMELPYTGGGYSMYLFVPNKVDGWRTAEQQLGSCDANLFGAGYYESVETVQVPKWEIETSIDGLPPMLSQLGIPSAFSPQADFSGIASDTALNVSDVVHKAKIVVDEKGTEAAAVTAVLAFGCSSYVPPKVIVDRPFLYFIVSKTDNVVLFQGTITSLRGA